MKDLKSVIVALGVVAASLSGCSGDSGIAQASPSSEPGSLEFFAEIARSEGFADAAQLEILDKAVSSGELSYEVYAQAVNTTLACIRDAGVKVDGPTTDNSAGFPQLRYGFAAGVDASGNPDNPLPDQCILAHSRYVEAAYSSQPSSQAALDAILEQKRSEVEQCINDAGVEVDSSLPVREWLAEIFESGSEGRDCVVLSGITQF